MRLDTMRLHKKADFLKKNILKYIFFMEKYCILIKIWLGFNPKEWIDKKSALV